MNSPADMRRTTTSRKVNKPENSPYQWPKIRGPIRGTETHFTGSLITGGRLLPSLQTCDNQNATIG